MSSHAQPNEPTTPILRATSSSALSEYLFNALLMNDSRQSSIRPWIYVSSLCARMNGASEAMNAEAARQDLAQAKKVTTQQYDTAIKQYDILRDNLASLTQARDLAAKTYSLSQNRFASGQTSAVELAEVATGLYQLDLSLLKMKYQLLMSAESVKKLGE